MASAAVVFLEQARRARERASRLRILARGINAPDAVERIEGLARELVETADQLEQCAFVLVSTAGYSGDIAAIKATTEYSQELVRRLRRRLGEPESD